MTGMTCRKAEEMVNKYIAHKLSVDELEDFLDHVESCSSCYDELETYFIVHRALQQLDEKEDGTVYDFRKLLQQDIRKSRRYIRQKRGLRFAVIVLLLISIAALLVLVIFGILGL